MEKITNEEIKVFSRYIYEISGIVLDKSKGYLLETRLWPLMREIPCKTFNEFFYKAKADLSGKLKHEIIDAISTNETFFFRDSTPFDLMRNKILPDLIDRRRQQYKSVLTPLRIWSAACSSGQEVYSIAITLKEMLKDLKPYNITIMGSDISDKVIAQASYGKYSRFEMERGLPKQYLHRYFNQMGNDWRIKDEIRAMAQFNKTNLLKPFGNIGKFDIIFCRNVAIYFSSVDRRKLFLKFADVLESDGALLLGGSESMGGLNLPFESNNYLRGIYYQKKGWEKAVVNSTLKPVTFSRSATQTAGKEVPKPKPVSMPTKPVQMKPSAARPKPVVLPSQLSPRRTVNVHETEAVSESPAKIVSDGASSLSSPTVIAEEKTLFNQPEAQGGITKKRPPKLKKSLLSSLHEKEKGGISRRSNQLADDVTQKSRKTKGSLLTKIASRSKDKKKCG